MRICIKALDTLTFGVGKPSVWGEDTFGAGMFPPFPSVVRGAVRAAWLHEHSAFDVANTDGDPTANYAVTEYALLLNDSPHFPVPADYLWAQGENALVPCRLMDNDNLSSITTPCQLWADAEGKLASAERRYVQREALQDYLRGNGIGRSAPLSDYVTEEDRVGIFMERGQRTAKKGMLYRSPLIRPAALGGGKSLDAVNTTSLAVSISGADGIASLTRFGGENKVARFAEYGGEISPSGAIGEDGRFKLYLATPAVFKSGYLPELPFAAKLLSAAVYGYDSIGGFDMKAKRPKPMRRAAKAGSVFYYELIENTPETRNGILSLHGTSISDFSREDGFGICYVGLV